MLHKLLDDDTKAHEYIEELYTILGDNLSNEWLVFSPLENIKLLNSGPFRLIDCTIQLMKQEDFPIERVKLYKLLGPNFDKWIINPSSPCIFTNVIAGDQSKAWELATDNYKTSLNLLRLYNSNFNIALKGSLLLLDYQEAILINNTTWIRQVTQFFPNIFTDSVFV